MLLMVEPESMECGRVLLVADACGYSQGTTF
jgi:hypothetical protein